MNQGKIKIELNCVSENNCVFTQIRLSDEGPGIPNDILKKIFDPFFTTKRNTGGTGLGLSITRGIIEKHNGGIRIDSELDVGTTVIITLPAQ
jgi:signal transduction histidine kinase